MDAKPAIARIRAGLIAALAALVMALAALPASADPGTTDSGKGGQASTDNVTWEDGP